MIKLCVYISSNCGACKRVVKILEEFSNSNSGVQLRIIDIKDTVKRISIVPAIFLNDKLYSLGDVNKSELKKYISTYSK